MDQKEVKDGQNSTKFKRGKQEPANAQQDLKHAQQKLQSRGGKLLQKSQNLQNWGFCNSYFANNVQFDRKMRKRGIKKKKIGRGSPLRGRSWTSRRPGGFSRAYPWNKGKKENIKVLNANNEEKNSIWNKWNFFCLNRRSAGGGLGCTASWCLRCTRSSCTGNIHYSKLIQFLLFRLLFKFFSVLESPISPAFVFACSLGPVLLFPGPRDKRMRKKWKKIQLFWGKHTSNSIKSFLGFLVLHFKSLLVPIQPAKCHLSKIWNLKIQKKIWENALQVFAARSWGVHTPHHRTGFAGRKGF